MSRCIKDRISEKNDKFLSRHEQVYYNIESGVTDVCSCMYYNTSDRNL